MGKLVDCLIYILTMDYFDGLSREVEFFVIFNDSCYK